MISIRCGMLRSRGFAVRISKLGMGKEEPEEGMLRGDDDDSLSTRYVPREPDAVPATSIANTLTVEAPGDRRAEDQCTSGKEETVSWTLDAPVKLSDTVEDELKGPEMVELKIASVTFKSSGFGTLSSHPPSYSR